MKKKDTGEKFLIIIVVIVVIILIILFAMLISLVTGSGGHDNSKGNNTEEQIETKYAREGEYSKVLTLPVGKKLAMSESSSSANAGINVLFAFPEYDEESYSIEAVADNEFRITNNSTKAVIQVRAINSNGVIMTKAQLKENLPELQPYDWNGYSVYEWTEHGNNKKFYLHYFFESQNKTWGFGYEIVSSMAYDSEITTDYEWGREIFRKLKIEEVTISE